MGVATTTNTEIYQGDGSTKAFAFPFYFFKTVDLTVYLYDNVFGTITPKNLGTDYTVTGTQNFQGLFPNGGFVNMIVAPTATQAIYIGRTPAEVQNYSLAQNGTISSVAIVQQMDYLTLLIQSLQDQVNRCVQVPAGMGPAFSTVLPSSLALPISAGQYLRVNDFANGLSVLPNVGWFSQTYSYTQFQAAASGVVLPLAQLPPTAILIGVCFKHSQAFLGTGLTDVYLTAGTPSAPSQFIPFFDLSTAPGDQNFSMTNPNYLGSWSTTAPVVVKANAVGGLLSALTQGSVTVYYNYQFI